MALLLIESELAARDQAAAQMLIEAIERAVRVDPGAELIEAHVTADLSRVYVAVEHPSADRLEEALGAAGLQRPQVDIAPVRLVGATLDEVRARRNGATYLVEWDFPEGLTMDGYLERKRTNSVHYAKVPEVRFLRTYVREDMDKCLCLYDAPDEDCVRKAREAVSAPVTRLSRIVSP